MARCLLQRYSTDDGSEQNWTWGSGCSGTDAPDFAYRGIQTMLNRRARRGLAHRFRHLFSAEKCQHKLSFLAALMNPGRLLDDIFKLSAEEAEDVRPSMHGKARTCEPLTEFAGACAFLAGLSFGASLRQRAQLSASAARRRFLRASAHASSSSFSLSHSLS